MQLRDHAPALCAGGASLAAIGCGSAKHAGALEKGLALPFPVFADPERRSFEAAGLRRDVMGLNPMRTTLNAMRAFLGGARQVGVQGDPWQLGGVFALSEAGELVYEHRSDAAGDHPPIEALIAALNPSA